MDFEAKLLLDCRNELGEGVQWNAERGRLYWTDILGNALWSCDAEGGAVQTVELETGLCSFAFDPAGNMLAAFRDGICRLDPETGEREMLHPYQPELPETRMNDGNLDRQGRFIVGGMDEAAREPITPVWKVDPHGVEILIEHVSVANSIAFSPDGTRMYFADSPTRTIWVYDYDIIGGRPGARRIFATYEEGFGTPDGSCVDSEGTLWNAVFRGGRVQAIAPDGAFVHRVHVPVPNVTCCALGGEGMHRMFITTARYGMDEAARARHPQAGSLFAVDLPVTGLDHGIYEAVV